LAGDLLDEDISKEQVLFLAKYKDWVTVKKMTIDATTTPQEVAGGLAGINATMIRKAYDFVGVNKEAIDAYAQVVCKGKRKGFAGLAEALQSIRPGELKAELLKSCKEEKFLPFAESYFLRCVLVALGMKTEVGTDDLTKVFPELKFPKPRGNFGKKK